MRLLNYANAQILLLGAHRENVEKELGIKFKVQETSRAVDRLYSILGISEDEYPSKPLVTGEWLKTEGTP